MTSQRCSCTCGNAAFDVTGPPLFRLLCHCTICQRFSGADVADVLVFDAAFVERPEASAINFSTYKPPPNVQRGQCAKCKEPAMEVFEAPLFPKLTMVPAGMFTTDTELDLPVAHIFYDKRVADVQDDLPKHQGFVPSQLAFGKYLLSAKLFGTKRS